MHKQFLLAAGFVFVIALCPAQTSGVPSPAVDSVIAEVDGTKLTLSDYERKHPGALFNARNAFYDAHRKAAQQLIDDYLLERQAKKEGVTVEQLMARHVVLPPDPSDEVLRVYYEGVDTGESFEAVRGQIIEALRERRRSRAKTAYIQSLRNQAKVALYIGPPRVNLNVKDVPVRGGSAPLLLVEFADYECPYCQQVNPTIKKILEEYKGKLAFAYKDFPLPMHSNAPKAAEAAHCARSQGKYWEYHDLLYSSALLAVPQLKQHARTLNLDGAAFDKCLDSGEQAKLVKAQVDEAEGLSLQGTPSFFINGRAIGGNQSYDSFRRVIEEELALAARATQTAAR